MGPKNVTALFAASLLAFACSPGGGGTDGGSGSSTSGGSTSSSGSSSGGTTGGGQAPTACSIADAGVFDAGTINPSNPCQVCDPSTDAGMWSPNIVCNPCSIGSARGICDMLGNCCLSHCASAGCTDPDGGIVPNSNCSIDSDCCGIPPSVSAGNNGC